MKGKIRNMGNNGGWRKACAIADFSNSRELRDLSVEYGDAGIRLDLTGCGKLETLKMINLSIQSTCEYA